MKSALAYDPADYDYGPATSAIRTFITDWAAIDWFAPSAATDDELTALFVEHDARARAYAPDIFTERVDVRCIAGGWPELAAWCKRVREQPGWDWRLGPLKQLSLAHARAHGWSIDAEPAHVLPAPPRPGDLFVRFPDANGKPSTIWNNVAPAPPDLGAAAAFYIEYARHDLINTIQWQLAERANDDRANPFVPLMHCYRAGAYPFSLGAETVVLFRFAS